MEITANISLKNGRHIGDNNIDKITAASTKQATGIYDSGNEVKNYFCKYKAKKEPEGYIFREVRFGFGISGHYQTLRELILCTLISSSNIKVHIDA